LIQKGGVLTTLLNSGEQWDSPNAWAPLVSFIVNGLLRVNSTESVQYARQIATDWLSANHKGFINDGYMHEKYNAFIPGAPGTGGEYAPQVGFGWTNGVVFEFLNQFRDAKPETANQ